MHQLTTAPVSRPGSWSLQLAGLVNGTQGNFSNAQLFVIPVPERGQAPPSAPTSMAIKSPSPKLAKSKKLPVTKVRPTPTPKLSVTKAAPKPSPAMTANAKAKGSLNKIFQFMPDLPSGLSASGVKCTSYVKNTTSTFGTREGGDCKWNGQDLTVDVYPGSAQSTKKLLDTLMSSGLAGGHTFYLKNWSLNLNDGPTAKSIMKLSGAVLE